MTTIDRTQLSVQTTAPRMTPQPPERRFQQALAQSGRALLDGAVNAASFLPGGNLLAAAVRGAVSVGATMATPGNIPGAPGRALSGTAEMPSASEAPTAAPVSSSNEEGSPVSVNDDPVTRGQAMSMRMLQLQESIAEENRRYTTLSNVLHTRHEMAKNAINNIR